MIHLYTGDGKGKTTAAAGLTLRAAGNGLRVVFAQFMKGSRTGEVAAMAALPTVTVLRSPKRFGFYSTLSEEQKRELTGIHNGILAELLARVRAGECDVAVLDEITYPVNWGLLDEAVLRELLACGKAEGGNALEVVLTGRDPADFLVESADYITQMCARRHPYERGVAARRGIEY